MKTRSINDWNEPKFELFDVVKITEHISSNSCKEFKGTVIDIKKSDIRTYFIIACDDNIVRVYNRDELRNVLDFEILVKYSEVSK